MSQSWDDDLLDVKSEECCSELGEKRREKEKKGIVKRYVNLFSLNILSSPSCKLHNSYKMHDVMPVSLTDLAAMRSYHLRADFNEEL
jgi:hypothetical protein